MFKKTKTLFCGLAALLLLAGCGGQGTTNDNDDDFNQNKDPHGQGFTMYVVGSDWNNWDPPTITEAEGCAFKKDEATGLYTIDLVITEEMAAVDRFCAFKFISSNSWSSQYGMEDLNWEKCDDTFKNQYKEKNPDLKKTYWHEGTSNRSNIEAYVAGTWHIEYNPANFTSEEVDGVPYTNKFTITIK